MMESAIKSTTTNPKPEDDVPIVTGRKAARSLRLFLGNSHQFDPAICDSPSSSELPRTSESMLQLSPDSEAVSSLPMLEPVSSATYFPHTSFPKATATTSQESDQDTLQHLTADLEFEHDIHGELKNIKKHLNEWTNHPRAHLQPPEAHTIKEPSAVPPTGEIYPLTVELRPFKNKVGGHTAIFRFSKKAVCKALVNRENIWYEAVERRHLNLLKFMPKYIGVLNVRYSSVVREEEFTPKIGPVDVPFDNASSYMDDIPPVDDTSKDFVKTKPVEVDSRLQKRSTNSHLRRPSFPGYQSLRGSDSQEDPPPEVLLDDNIHIIPDLLWKHYSTSAPNSASQKLMRGASLNSLHSLKKDRNISIGSTSVNTDLQAQIIQEVFAPHNRKPDEIFQMEDDFDMEKDSVVLSDSREDLQNPVLRKHTRFERFILLEDLTTDMAKPCVLDLKMGTRQYGVDATDQKQASQRKKCSLTSSKELGTRVCGLQVWNQATNKYVMKDKYFGRKLRSGLPFAKALTKFLYDGTTSQSILSKIPQLINHLQELYSYFQDLNGYRMYGSSILLIYDGALPSSEAEIKIHIIDFAQSVIGGDVDYQNYRIPPKHPELADMGYLKGLRSLILYFKAIFKVVSGDHYDDVSDMKTYLKDYNRSTTSFASWIENFAEGDESKINEVCEGDPFDMFAHYNDPADVSD